MELGVPVVCEFWGSLPETPEHTRCNILPDSLNQPPTRS